MRFVITEEERNRIKSLYEQTTPNDFYWVGEKRYFDHDKKWRVEIRIFSKKNDESVAWEQKENTDLKTAYDEVLKGILKDLSDKKIVGVVLPKINELKSSVSEEYLPELKGKTFNTFSDPKNLSFEKKHTIKKIEKSGEWGTLTIWLADRIGDFVFFRCGSDNLELHGWSSGKYEEIKIYSNKLVQYIKSKYCTNAGGSPKPKSDFLP